MQTTTLPATHWNEIPGAEDEVTDIDLDAELESLFAEGLTYDRRNRAERRKALKGRTRFVTMYRGQRRWAPTQVPPPIRIARGRRRAKAARASRKRNR